MRWRRLIEADAGRNEEQSEFVRDVLAEADQPADAEILGKLANELKPGYARKKLLIHQTELTDDCHQAAEIMLQLYTENQLHEAYLVLLVKTLQRDGRDQRVVEILGRQLRKGRKLELILIDYLAASVQSVGTRIRRITRPHGIE